MLTSSTANLHLHPHPPPNSQSKLASVPPGAFPTFTSVSSSSSDFSRTITLTPEISTQPIGRSSRNTAKGLVADRNNGFFESAVMSRAHAEVRLVLEPTRKVRTSPFYNWGKFVPARVKESPAFAWGLENALNFSVCGLPPCSSCFLLLYKLFPCPFLFPFQPSFPFLTFAFFPSHHLGNLQSVSRSSLQTPSLCTEPLSTDYNY